MEYFGYHYCVSCGEMLPWSDYEAHPCDPDPLPEEYAYIEEELEEICRSLDQ